MKLSLIAFAACYAVTSSAFALPADLPGTNPPRLALTDLPGTNPPRLG